MTGMPTAATLAEAVRRGDVTATALCEQALSAVAKRNGTLNAFLRVTPERALARARAIDRARELGDCGPLCGVPIAIKDNICVAGLETTAGSKVLEGYVPPENATVVDRLERAGAVIVGNTNCDEFAMGSSTEHSTYGPTRNPHDLTRIPGGSSGGSAAAVAAGMVTIALGSDTGGSIRQPAALSGVVGLRPTYGRVSRYGLIAFASSLDQIGPLCLDARDAALVLGVTAGFDPRDSTSSRRPVPDYAGVLGNGTSLKGLRVGVVGDVLAEGVDSAVLDAFNEAVRSLEALGASTVQVTLPHTRHATAVYYLIATAEASSNLARYDGVRYGRRAAPAGGDGLLEMYERTREEGFGAEVKRRIVLGTFVLSSGYYDAYYLKAQQVRTLIARDYEQALAHTDVVVMPTTPTPAFRLGERTEDPLQMYLSDVFTVGTSLAGVPCVSVPCGRSDTGLPVGFQIVGRPFDEAQILRVADAYQRHTSE